MDPRRLFANVDFDPAAVGSGTYKFDDSSSDQPSRNLYQNLRSSGPYEFTWSQ
jgi:hypothetical protein